MIVIVDADDDDHADDSEAVDEDQGEGAGGDTGNGLAAASKEDALVYQTKRFRLRSLVIWNLLREPGPDDKPLDWSCYPGGEKPEDDKDLPFNRPGDLAK